MDRRDGVGCNFMESNSSRVKTNKQTYFHVMDEARITWKPTGNLFFGWILDHRGRIWTTHSPSSRPLSTN